MRQILAIFALAGFILSSAFFSAGNAQGTSESIQIKGKISDVDLIKSTVTIQVANNKGEKSEIKLKMTSHTRINRADLRLSPTDIDEGDEVAVEYLRNPMSFNEPEALWINLKPVSPTAEY